MQVHSLFPTPVLTGTWDQAPKYNPVLESLVCAEMARTPGTKTSNVGAWRSHEDLMDWQGEAVAAFSGWLDECTKTYLSQVTSGATARLDSRVSYVAWANVNASGDYRKPHLHAGRQFAGVYYVKIPGKEAIVPDEGCLDFIDPRGGAAMMPVPGDPFFPPRYQVRPTEGLLVLFPAWLLHMVNPHFATGDRISIGIDINVE